MTRTVEAPGRQAAEREQWLWHTCRWKPDHRKKATHESRFSVMMAISERRLPVRFWSGISGSHAVAVRVTVAAQDYDRDGKLTASCPQPHMLVMPIVCSGLSAPATLTRLVRPL